MIGPQRGPASVAQINAQVKQANREFARASGLMICDRCGREYYDHPPDESELGYDGHPLSKSALQRRPSETMKHTLINGDCLEVLKKHPKVDCIFADPPDNIGLGYDAYDDKLDNPAYVLWLEEVLSLAVRKASVVWFSFNARWTFDVGQIFRNLMYEFAASPDPLEGKACVQVFTFGQHNKNDLGNNHRPLWRLKRKSAPLYPDAIKVPSWRQRNGDKRAAPGGRVPGDVFDMQPKPPVINGQLTVESKDGKTTASFEVPVHPGDVFDFPRVTGNSKQRCDWHPTQLHEELVERCIRLVTKEGDTVLDPFGGTGTTLRVCKTIGRRCTLIELDPKYCAKLRELHPDLKKMAA